MITWCILVTTYREVRDMENAIAAVSMQMRMDETAMALEMAMLKRAMDMEQAIAAQMLESLKACAPQAPTPSPSFGHRLNVLA